VVQGGTFTSNSGGIAVQAPGGDNAFWNFDKFAGIPAIAGPSTTITVPASARRISHLRQRLGPVAH